MALFFLSPSPLLLINVYTNVQLRKSPYMHLTTQGLVRGQPVGRQAARHALRLQERLEAEDAIPFESLSSTSFRPRSTPLTATSS